MGIFLGLLAATAASASNVFLKLLTGFNPNFLTWVRMGAVFPILAFLVTIFSGWNVPPPEFWLLLFLVKTPSEVLLAYISTRAIHLSPLSIIGPIGAFTSIFLIPVGFLTLGELPTRIGLTGVLLIFFGSFFLGWKKEERISTGFKMLIRDKGVMLAFAAAFIASINISITKVMFQYASPLLAAFYFTAVITVVLMPYLFYQARREIKRRAGSLVGLWSTTGLAIAFHNVGLSLMPAVYFISLKRLSMVLDVFFGRVFFKEEHFRERLVGSALMVLGIVFIAFG